MNKNNDLEDELNNENLDFLEEEHDSSSASSKNQNSSHNLINNINFKLIKNLGIIIIIFVIIGGAIFGLINRKSKNPLKNESITKNNLNKQNENPKTELPINETNKSISNNHLNNVAEIIDKPINEINNNNNDMSQLQEIGQIKLPQPVKNPNPISSTPLSPLVTTDKSNSNNPEDQNSNNNLSWQDIKQSIENNTPTLQKQPNKTITPIADNLINNQENNTHTTNVNGFERTANNIQVTQAQNNQANEDYKAQQEYIKELKNIISNISKDLNNNVDQIKELQNNLIDISKFMSNINNNVNNIDNKVLNLTKSLDSISGEVKNVKKYIQEEDIDLNVNLKSSEPDLFSNNPEYIIHAVIPGRAWLKNTAGQIITVAEGEQLGDYGKIAVIDANNNLVRTSSGVIFR